MQSSPSQEPTIADVLQELKTFQADVDRRFEKIDQRFEKIDQRFENLDYKFETYEKASDKLVRLATTIIVAAAPVAVLLSAFQSIGPLLTQMVAANQ